MEAYNKKCKDCKRRQISRELIDSDGNFYRGFSIRQHHHQKNDGSLYYIVCARFAEGGESTVLEEISKYVGDCPPEPCRCHPHEEVVAVRTPDRSGLKDGESRIRKGIDFYWDSLHRSSEPHI